MECPFPLLRHRVGCVAGVLLLGASLLGAESARRVPTFGVDVEVVNLNLSVTDAKGRHVTDLGEGDVAVFEDGVPQQICVFTQEKWPISLTILMDGSGSMNPVLPVAQEAAIRLLRTLGPQDQAKVAQFNRRLTVLQDFTADAAALEASVRSVRADGETALYNALYIALKDLSAGKGGELRRRAIVVLTDGDDTASMLSDEQVLELARQAEVGVYAIGLLERRSGSAPSPSLPVYFLTALARETGGRAFFPSSLGELEGVYDRIAEELRTLYGVGYVSSNPRKDGRWRRIAIQTLRGNFLVRHRAGYFAPLAEGLSRLLGGGR